MKALVVGVSTRAIAESGVQSGYQIVALDAFGDMDLQLLCECYSLKRDFHTRFSALALFSASMQLDFDAVVYISNLENHPDVVHHLSERHRLIGNTPEVLKRVRCWPTLFSVLAHHGFDVPRTIYNGGLRRADPARTWLRKPVNTGGGHAISFWNKNMPPGRAFMLQEYLPGISCSASFVANGRECVVVGLSEQLVGRPELGTHGFRYCGSLLPLEATRDPIFGPPILKRIKQMARLLTREFGLVGVNCIDFVLNNDNLWPIEVNPRYSASMELVERAYGLPMFDMHLNAVLDGRLPEFDISTQLANGPFYGKAILYAERDAIAPDTRRWVEYGIRDVPHPGEPLPKGGPICTVLAQGYTRDACMSELVARATALKGEIYG